MRNQQATKLIFEMSRPGRRAHHLPSLPESAEAISELLPADVLADEPPPLPEVAEGDVVRHFVNLSTLNMSVDTHFYPLGSCTMKYNPKRNERMASLAGIGDVHPLQRDGTVGGVLQMMYELQDMLGEISGLPGVSLQPAAGAHGELTALLVAAAYFNERGESQRTVVLTADSAHGTNPASAQMAGFSTKAVKSNADGLVDLEDLKSKLNDETAVFMLTNPNTLGLFDSQVGEIADLVHEAGGLIYLDGANMNAILGIARPGDFGADLMHFNPHKTFSGPHGGGGPGAGPICVRDFLADYLPGPVVVRDGDGYRCQAPSKSIGRVRSFFGNVGVLVRAYIYIRTYGKEGLRKVSEDAVLGANYLLSKVRHILDVPHGDRCMHEFVASAKRLKKDKHLTAMDIAKRLLDYGFHAPTVYFPLVVEEAVMVEPTETESKETLDAFAQALFRITEESGDLIDEAPHSTKISRPDDVAAARKPILKWSEGE
ncbi:aminomethyl-transferring glycine dehydrogenase subunit GcvPB [Roseiconus lacunae]|uniref:Probable glycine dehydrogenase (decarboxylating) subunit 2 n=1 Tax=Roseiconus lacunae TaxID=2605694 RepID=A0ABT7PIB0_9BACT|nr:aminomethyl-transferring glycine dehydrogenase subunit GcvPB [Roseiconus lacunae]MCD0458346.1 aminomethyl-transferring glycine dehydrogenase subunit GcvPB [Roseiconus lacunae]MDM4016236.1 aminomethyl-transferring glycine dehydrogenase subunit GcvPB [Roseiconus lacunae]WRQ52161.1 aminomethyl-transferring glycine dehydrogenase subunit GcvPB [Stieleria sp. HD01]